MAVTSSLALPMAPSPSAVTVRQPSMSLNRTLSVGLPPLKSCRPRLPTCSSQRFPLCFTSYCVCPFTLSFFSGPSLRGDIPTETDMRRRIVFFSGAAVGAEPSGSLLAVALVGSEPPAVPAMGAKVGEPVSVSQSAIQSVSPLQRDVGGEEEGGREGGRE